MPYLITKALAESDGDISRHTLGVRVGNMQQGLLQDDRVVVNLDQEQIFTLRQSSHHSK